MSMITRPSWESLGRVFFLRKGRARHGDVPQDAAQLEAWRAGDQDAGEALIERHYASILRFFRTKAGEDADDLVQLTFLRCVEASERYRGDAGFRAFLFGIARNVLFCRADQAEVLLIGNDKHDAAILILQQIGLRRVKEFRHDNMATLHQANMAMLTRRQNTVGKALHPGAGRIHQRTGPDFLRLAGLRIPQRHPPLTILLRGPHAFTTHTDAGAMLARLLRHQHHKTGVIDLAVGILKAIGQG